MPLRKRTTDSRMQGACSAGGEFAGAHNIPGPKPPNPQSLAPNPQSPNPWPQTPKPRLSATAGSWGTRAAGRSWCRTRRAHWPRCLRTQSEGARRVVQLLGRNGLETVAAASPAGRAAVAERCQQAFAKKTRSPHSKNPSGQSHSRRCWAPPSAAASGRWLRRCWRTPAATSSRV